MEKKVLYNVLRQISLGQVPDSAPDQDYLKSLENIGLVKLGWDNKLTSFGNEIYLYLEDKLYTYST